MTNMTNSSIQPTASSNPLKAVTRFVGAENLSLIIALVLLVALIASQTPFFFAPRNLMNIGMNLSVVGLLGVGMTIVIVSGALDISVGSIAGVASVVTAMLVTYAGTVLGGIAVGVLAGAILGIVNAAIITYLRVNAVVATLATLSAYRGLAFLIAPEGRPIGVLDQNFAWLGSGRILEGGGFPGIPASLLLLILIAAIGHFVMSSTVFGRAVYSMGGNPAAARLAGISLNRMKFYIFTSRAPLPASRACWSRPAPAPASRPRARKDWSSKRSPRCSSAARSLPAARGPLWVPCWRWCCSPPSRTV